MKLQSFAQLRLIYQQCLRNQNTNSLYTKDLLQAFKNAIIINQNKELNILKQGTINYKEFKFIESITNCKNRTQYTKKDFLMLLSNKFQYFNQIKISNNILPFYVYKIDFSNQKQIYQIFNRFIIQNDQNIKKQNTQFFIQNFSQLNGLLLPFINNLVLFLLNKNKFTNNTIMHQFTHYLQLVLNTQLINKQQFSSDELKSIKFLGLSENYLNYIFDQRQFIPHINDCVQTFNQIYQNVFKNKYTIQQFKKYLISYGQTLNIYFNIYQIFNQYASFNKDMSGLFCFCISLFLNKNKKLVIDILNKSL